MKFLHFRFLCYSFFFAPFFVMSFNIPIPFGNIGITKTPDGATQVGLNSGLNIGGNGVASGLTFIANNGSFSAQSGGGVLLNGNKFGGNTTLGVDKQQGLTSNTDVNIGDKGSLHGGLGNENTFINDLVNLINAGKNKGQRRQKRRK